MTVFVLQIPHQMPPKAWSADTEGDALWALEADFDRESEFADLSEAVGHDMHSGHWAKSIPELREAIAWTQHQRLAAEAAIDRLEQSQ